MVTFIKIKIESGTNLDETLAMLVRAGFDDQSIEQAFGEVKKLIPDLHQHLAKNNNFLPSLLKK